MTENSHEQRDLDDIADQARRETRPDSRWRVRSQTPDDDSDDD